jgi:hypothetical protein
MSEGAKVIPEKQNAVNMPIIEPKILSHQPSDFLLKKDGKARNIGISIIPTKKNAKLKKINEIKFDLPECDTILPISLKKFIKKEYPLIEGSS